MPGVFARVSTAYNWIKEEVCDKGKNLDKTDFRCNKNGVPPTRRPTSKPTMHPTSKPTTHAIKNPSWPKLTPNNPYWWTLIEENFDNGLGDFKDGGVDAKRMKKRKGRRGVVRLQRGQSNGDQASISVNVDVSMYSECRVIVSFYLTGMGEADSWSVEYAMDGSKQYEVAKSFSTRYYANKKWYDDDKKTNFSVKKINSMNLRLRCKGNSGKDAVYIDDVALECQ